MSQVPSPATAPTRPFVRVRADLAAGGWLFLGLGAAGWIGYVAHSPRLASVGGYAGGALFFLLIGWIALRDRPPLGMRQAVAMPREARREDGPTFRRTETMTLA